MARNQQRNHYIELAAHLNPNDIAEGTRQVDQAILSALRHRANRKNLGIFSVWLGTFLGLFGVLMFGMPFIGEVMSNDSLSAPSVPPYFGAVLALVGAALLLLGSQLRDVETDAGIPREVAEWLESSDKERYFRNWHELYWPHWKRDANRKRLGVFTFWRRHLVEERRVSDHDWAETIADRR